jgi:hypothetical protein
MAKQRFVNTRFWSDSFIVGLSPLERYLFLYFLTNEHTTICGIYELPLRTISFETGIREKDLVRILERLTGKIYFIDGWVFIRNFQKHQYARGNSNVKIGIEKEKREIPEAILARVDEILSGKPKTDTPSMPLGCPSEGGSTLDTETETETDLDSDLEREGGPGGNPDPAAPSPARAQTPSGFAMIFFRDEAEQRRIAQGISETRLLPFDAVFSEIRKFAASWTERNRTGTKARWELERTFEVDSRLRTWLERVDRFNPQSAPKGATIV